MSTLQDKVSRLQIVLQSEEDVHLRMRTLLRREESELIGLDPEILEDTVEEKRALAEEARLLEETRQVVTRELTGALGLGDADVKLSLLIAHLGDEAGQLPALHARLSALITSSRSLLDANQSFANRSLARVQETLRMLGRSVPDEVGYGPGSRRATAAGRGRLVRQAI